MMDNLSPNYQESADFLKAMFPGGDCHLSAMYNGKAPITKTFKSDDKGIIPWIKKHNQAQAGISFAVNGLKDGVIDTKAKKTDVKHALALHVDVDDPSEQARDKLSKFVPSPTAIVMSGGGYHAYWRFDQSVQDLNTVEQLNKALAQEVGGDHCQNIDRIMRVPGTINWPSNTKLKRGRVPVVSRLLPQYTNFDRTYGIAELAFILDELKDIISPPNVDIVRGNITPLKISTLNIDEKDRVVRLIVYGLSNAASKAVKDRFKSRSELLFSVILRLLELRIEPEKIIGILINPDYEISERVLEQSDPIEYCTREIKSAKEKFNERWPDTTMGGKPLMSLPNALMALRKSKLHFEFDAFHNRKRIEGHSLQEFQGDITDDGSALIRDILIESFGFDVGKGNLLDAITIFCIKNRFHPILDYLDGLKWDGVKRVETLFMDYFGAEDTPLNRAAGKIMLTAAVRRVRDPGCKFDLMVVLEGPQGTGKSTALILLAGEENFSDQSLFTLRDKEQMEAFEGVWIFEVAELDGMSGAEVSRIKALITRRFDQARAAFARFKERWPRQGILVGTTNEDYYLKDDTGNRRFIPIKTTNIDLAGIARDRDQLWAEASVLEAQGELIYLTGALVEQARVATQRRMLGDPWEDILVRVEGTVKDGTERILTETLFGEDYLHIPNAQLKSFHPKKLAKVMNTLGWNGPKQMRIGGKKRRGYSRPSDQNDFPF